jgi:hypothetical protein
MHFVSIYFFHTNFGFLPPFYLYFNVHMNVNSIVKFIDIKCQLTHLSNVSHPYNWLISQQTKSIEKILGWKLLYNKQGSTT